MNLSDSATILWKQYLQQNLFDPTLVLGVIDLQGPEFTRYQKAHYGDMIILLDDPDKPIWTIELKIRKESDEKYYLKHNDIAIETKGNCNRLDGDDGSAIHNSKADLFGTAFFTSQGLKHVHIYTLKDGLAPWLQMYRHRYQHKEKKNLLTNGMYHGSWIPIPIEDIKQFAFRVFKPIY